MNGVAMTSSVIMFIIHIIMVSMLHITSMSSISHIIMASMCHITVCAHAPQIKQMSA